MCPGDTIQLPRIKIVDDEISIWLVYAGYRRRHLEQFRNQRRIFLDLPGFDANEGTFSDEEEIARRLAMSRAIREWILKGEGDRPPRRISAHQPEQYPSGSSEARALTAELGNISRMFIDAKPGDLVISPPMGHYNRLLIGEIIGQFSPDDNVSVAYWGNETVPARRVRWLATNSTRRSFSSSLARSLQNQHAISRVDDKYYDEIQRVAYPNFLLARHIKNRRIWNRLQRRRSNTA